MRNNYKHEEVFEIRQEPKLCPKCGKERGFQSYCKECQNEYQRSRRKLPEIRARETAYRREYRKR
ncbi:MAG: hypothetical protein ACYDBV_13390 [Nitrospiria bacterium]